MVLSSKTMSDIIITCDCRDMPKFAQEAFAILFPDEIHPLLITKKEIPPLARRYEGTDFGAYLLALQRNREKFARYFIISKKGDVVEQYDLRKGTRIL